MKKFPFTSDGFQAIQQELYQLDTVALKIVSQQIKHSFTTWILNSFELSISQINFLNGLNEQFLSFSAEQVSFAVVNRLPITLAKDVSSKNDDDDQGKIIYTKSSLISSQSKLNGFVPEGNLQFVINYNA